MKITFVTSTLTSGGAERVISILANEFYCRGNSVEVIALTSISPDFYKLDEGIRFLHADKECNGGLLQELVWFRKHVKHEKPDVVIAFMEAVYEFVLMALLGSGIPVVSSERKEPSAIEWYRKILRFLLLPFAKKHVVQTQKIKNYYNFFVRRKTVIIYNPVNEEVFTVEKRPKDDVIVNVGRLYPQKCQKLLIDAFNVVKDKYPSYKLVIWGEGYLRSELEKHIEQLHLENRVLLPGRTEKVIQEIANAKILCIASSWEGMSNAMIEAFCVGTPVISTKVSGTDELIVNGKNGLLVDINNIDQLVQSLDLLMGNDNLQQSLADNAAKLREKFKLNTIVQQWESLLQSVVSKN